MCGSSCCVSTAACWTSAVLQLSLHFLTFAWAPEFFAFFPPVAKLSCGCGHSLLTLLTPFLLSVSYPHPSPKSPSDIKLSPIPGKEKEAFLFSIRCTVEMSSFWELLSPSWCHSHSFDFFSLLWLQQNDVKVVKKKKKKAAEANIL